MLRAESPTKTIKNLNGLVLLLPFLEQAWIYERWDFRVRFGCPRKRALPATGGALPVGPAAIRNANCRPS